MEYEGKLSELKLKLEVARQELIKVKDHYRLKEDDSPLPLRKDRHDVCNSTIQALKQEIK